MQKRTNPLALKMDAAAKQATNEMQKAPVQPAQEILADETLASEVPVIESPVKEIVSAPVEETAPAAPAEQAKPALTKRCAPVQVEQLETEAEAEAEPKIEGEAPQAPRESTMEKAAPMMGGAVQWQMVSSKRTEPRVEEPRKPVVVSWSAPTAPAEPVVEEPAIEETVVEEPAVEAVTEQAVFAEPETERYEQYEEPIVDEDILGEEQTDVLPQTETAASAPQMPLSEDAILDEQLPPSIEDYEMAARFGLCGRVSRGLKVGKISRDVCRLAQLMHPNESLSSILEGALLTRIYLENRDAFDALAEMLEKKGGHIKC